MSKILLILLLNSVFCSFFSSYIAGQKNRGKIEWFALGFLFGFLALIAIASIPSLVAQESNNDSLLLSADVELHSLGENEFTGVRNIQDSNYQLFLAKKYGISRDSILDKFIIGKTAFENLFDSMVAADHLYSEYLINCRRLDEQMTANSAINERISLRDAVWNGNYVAVSRHLGCGLSANDIDGDGISLVELANRRGDKAILKLLQAYGGK